MVYMIKAFSDSNSVGNENKLFIPTYFPMHKVYNEANVHYVFFCKALNFPSTLDFLARFSETSSSCPSSSLEEVRPLKKILTTSLINVILHMDT